MNAQLNIKIGLKEIVDLVKQLPIEEKGQLFHLLEEEQYANNIPEEHKMLVRERIKKSNKNPERMVDEKTALELINAM
jgi:hypothetical protein